MTDMLPGNRREFLKGTAGAALTTSIFTGNLKGANDRITGAFIGVGVMGQENLRAAMKHGVEVKAVCDVYQPTLERAAAMARREGQQPKEVKDFRQILADKSIDVVCISAPDHWHPYMAIEACKAGKDVYVEKPACLAINEGQLMVKAARKYDRLVQAGTWQRSGEHFQKAAEIVRSGELGKITFCRTWIYSSQKPEGIGNPPDAAPPSELDWELWQGPVAARTFNPNRFGVYPRAYSYFRYFWDYAGGPLTDSGVHVIDSLQMAFDEAVPRSVTALGGKYWLTDNSETPDTMLATFEYNGFLSSWDHRSNNTGGQPGRTMGAMLYGTRGSLYVDRARFEVQPDRGSDLQPREMKRVTDPHPVHWANFLDCVRTRKKPNSDIETCFRSSLTCLLGNAALRSRQRLDWDDQRQVVLQESARPYLYREYRKPWKLEV